MLSGMTLLHDAYLRGQEEALQKFAATRGVREIRQALRAGTPEGLARANMLAKTPGVLNANNTMGSQISHLGHGGEGLATLVAHPQHGVAVRKTFNPAGGVYSPEIVRRKEQVGSVPGAAKFYGAAQTPHGTPVHFNEFVQGKSLAPSQMTPEQRTAYQRAMNQTNRGLRQQGFVGRDIRPGNMLMTPSGEAKVIDFMPFQRHEATTNAEQRTVRRRAESGEIPARARDMLLLEPAGSQLFAKQPPGPGGVIPPPLNHPSDRGGFTRFMLTGQNAAPKMPPQDTTMAGTAVLPQASASTVLTPTTPMRAQPRA